MPRDFRALLDDVLEAILNVEEFVGAKIDDGVYLLHFEGDGLKVTLTDGAEALLRKRISPSIGMGRAGRLFPRCAIGGTVGDGAADRGRQGSVHPLDAPPQDLV